MNPVSKRLVLANSFGTLGYLSTLFQWLWSFLIIIYPVLVMKPSFLFLTPQNPSPTSADTTPIEASPVMVAIAIAATIAIMAITVVVVVRLPKTIGKRSAAITHATAKTVLPAITHHKKITKKKRIELSYRIILVIKLLLVAVPLLALPFAQPIDTIATDIIWAFALFCAACSTAYFIVQQLIARFARVDIEKLW